MKWIIAFLFVITVHTGLAPRAGAQAAEAPPPSKSRGDGLPPLPSDYKSNSAAPIYRLTASGLVAPNVRVTAAFDWEMEARFRDGSDADTVPDLPNVPEYALNLSRSACGTINCDTVVPKFAVTFTAKAFAVPVAGGGSSQIFYRWQISGPGTQMQVAQASPVWRVELAEGIYDVTMTAALASGIQNGQIAGVVASRTISQRVPIEDILVASIGDSFSSGEGNPERVRLQVNNRQALWADDGSGDPASIVNQRHRRAHRSTLSWPAQMALDIERADKHTSVTFVSVATTGATIHDLLNTGRGAELEPDPPGGMPGQLDELKSIVRARRIDLLTISIGINDIGFADLLRAFILGNENSIIADNAGAIRQYAEMRPYDQRMAVVAAAHSGNLGAIVEDACGNCPGISGLSASYASLANALKQRFPDRIQNVTVVSYPDPTARWSGNQLVWCQKILDDLVAPSGAVLSQLAGLVVGDMEIGGKEQQTMVSGILNPLNDTISGAAAANGWSVVRVQGEFANGHGYCAPAPLLRPGEAYDFALGNPYPGLVPAPDNTSSWFRTAQHSRVVQGPLDPCAPTPNLRPVLCLRSAVRTLGTMHPNEVGHQAVKNAVLRTVMLPVDVPGVGFHDGDDQISEARTTIPPLEVIHPSTDVDMFVVDTAALSARSAGTANVGPSLTVSVLQPSGGTSPLSPMIRLFDGNGTKIAEVRGRSMTHRLTSGDARFIVAISADRNTTYDPIDGIGDTGGGMSGGYRLTVGKSWGGGSLTPSLVGTE